MGGEICKLGEECIGAKVGIKEEICCLATCEEEKEDYSNKIIGYTLLVLVLVFGYYFYKKSRKTTKKKINF